MNEQMKKEIMQCRKKIEKEGYQGDLAVAYAKGYLNEYPELIDLFKCFFREGK